MKTLLLTLLVSTCSYCQGCLEMDIMIIGDYSGSIYGRQKYVADAVDAFISRFDLSERGMKIGILTFNDNSTLWSGLTTNKKKLQQTVTSLYELTPSGSTNLSTALQDAALELQYGRKVPKLIVLITDGMPDNAPDAEKTAREIYTFFNINICGIYVNGSYGDAQWLEKICTNSCFSRSSFEYLAEQLKRMDICL